jgi:2-polyprenyl-3-methyl-5-hydroxy-6-metoxy-1,4-benzoquinol methylase
MNSNDRRDALDNLLGTLLRIWPDHADYVRKSFAERDSAVTATSREVAAGVLRLSGQIDGGLDALCEDYRFLCEKIVLPEEFYFRRHGRYRLSSFEDAERECYANAPYMVRYMNGLLVSNVIWSNHAHAMAHYMLKYLPSLAPGSSHLEIGPGHGLFLSLAASHQNVATASGWDISPTSIERTRAALTALGVNRPVQLNLRNLFESRRSEGDERFDSIVMSEILEHLESPVDALKAALALLRPRGSLWVNVPANSPAPDHIFLVEDCEHACELVRAAGFDIVDSAAFPMTGATLERAVRQKLSVSCVVHARAPG